MLLAGPVSLAAQTESAVQNEYQRISRALEREQEEYSKAFKNARSDAEREKLKYPDGRKYADEMIALAEKDPKDLFALHALVWAVRYTYGDPTRAPKVLALLKQHYLESEDLASICAQLAYGGLDANSEFLNEVLEKNPHDKVRAAASLSLGRILLPDDPRQAEKHFKDVIDKYGTDDQKQLAKGELFKMQYLAVGKVAPEIEGEDVDGKKFKLSDYRGKVVVLDFWGDW